MNTQHEDEGQAWARTTDLETSHDAANAVRGIEAARLERKVLDALTEHATGLTSHELVSVTGIPYESVTPRIKPLRERGWILDSGLRRGERRKSIVWISTPQGSTCKCVEPVVE